jgi:hypothetical protein
MQDLSLEIRQVHDIAVYQSDRADTGRSKIEGRRRTEASGPDQENLGFGHFDLSFATDLIEDDMPAIALYLLFGKFHSTRLS